MNSPCTSNRFGKAIAMLLLVILAGCVGWAPGQQAYWDEKVKELCEKDGGVTIYEPIRVSRAEINRHVLPMTRDGKLGIALKQLAHPDAPAYAERKTTYIREGNPQVARIEWIAVRRSDRAVAARWVIYGRLGGDPPSPAHESHFSCPDPEKITLDLQPLFIVQDDLK